MNNNNENALREVQIWQNLHFDKYVCLIELKNQYGFVLSQDASVGEIWWRYIKAFVSYAWSSIRTHK